MENRVDSHRPGEDIAALEVRLLGPLTVRRQGVPLRLPSSRKVRGLLAYLALAPRPVSRGQLCELLWDVPNDPRGELRWCLSKIRALVDEPGCPRVRTEADAVALDLSGCFVDAIEIADAAQDGMETVPPERLRRMAGLFSGEFVDGLEIDRSPAFKGWLTVQRRRFRSHRLALLEHIVRSAADEEALRYLEEWLELAPFECHAHELLLQALARRGQIREGDEHLEAAVRLFEAEGLDSASIREAWRSIRAQRPRVAARGAAAPAGAQGNGLAAVSARRASIAVMPFRDQATTTGGFGGLADALADDIITRLAKLRSLFVIAQGSVFALSERSVGPEEAGRLLNVDYVVHGSVRRQGGRLVASIELAETLAGRIVWAEVFDQSLDDAFLVLDEIGNRIVASIAGEIETIERNRAILKPPDSLDAWEAHHRGLWHMYRFSKPDNDRARHFFETAVRLDPTFSRAYAGLSFTHFQNAFQGWEKREPEIERAYAAAGQSLMADDRDPAAHWAMGRALWLRGRLGESVDELEQAVDLSPNFAVGHYTLAFVRSQAGDPSAAVASSDLSRRLSPFDPLLFGMFGARAMALVRLGRFEEAADWGLRAAARPNAHAHILAIAAYSLALADRLDEARVQLAVVRRTLPHYGIDDFLTAMQFAPDGEKLFREAARRIGSGSD